MPLLIEEKFNIEATDNEIIETFTGWFHESQTFHDAMLPHQKLAEQYYIGNQTEKDQIPDYLSDTVENRIFEPWKRLCRLQPRMRINLLLSPEAPMRSL